jgi:hypothetical protein
LLVFVVATTAWFFVTDLLSNGGDWTAIVTILYGLVLLTWPLASTPRSRIYGFWLHVVAGVTIGGGLLWFFTKRLRLDRGRVRGARLQSHSAIASCASSWVVPRAWGLFQVTTHFAEKWAEVQFLAFFPLGLFFLPFFGLSRATPPSSIRGPLRSRTACSGSS